MNIRVDRIAQAGQSTMSIILVDGEQVCFGLEDIYRPKKEYGRTRISAGTYPLVRRFAGRHFERYRQLYRHKSSLWIQDVPDFTWIMIHAGNVHTHTEGCLLTGTSIVTGQDGSFETRGSIKAYRKLYTIISARIDSETTTITFRDLDRCTKCFA